jgi:hypothetical protein
MSSLNKLYFIHIPKSGGTTIQDQYCIGKNKIIFKHEGEHPSCLSKTFIKSNCNYNWDTYLLTDPIFLACKVKFTIIRNPFDMLKSYFLSRWGDYDSGIKEKLPHKNFKELIKLYCSSEENWHIPLLKKFLYNQIFDDNGNCCCDYAVIFDNLNDGFEQLLKINGYDVEKINLHKNVSNTKNYKNYYDEEMIELVNNKCRRELDMFNFDFNGYKGIDKLLYIKDFKLNWNNL